MSMWIPIGENLPVPEEGEIVLVTCKTTKGVRSVNRAWRDRNGFWHGSGSMANVTAWMLMPKPYEGDEE